MDARDEARFAELSERHRRELQVHGYRMLGNLEQAEDAVLEALPRAWKGRASFVCQARAHGRGCTASSPRRMQAIKPDAAACHRSVSAFGG